MTKAAAVLTKQGKQKMAMEDRKNMELELREIEDQLKKTEPGEGHAPSPELLQNKPALIQRKRQIEEILNQDDDLIAKGDEKISLQRRAKEIEAEVKKEMPSERQMNCRPTDHQDFNVAVEKTIYHQKKYGPMLQEWQEIQRRLNPNDPEAADIRRLM